MNHAHAADAFDGDHRIPSESGVPEIGYPYPTARRAKPLQLLLEPGTLRITQDMIRVFARVPGCRSAERVPVIVVRVPDGEIRWDPIFIDGELKMIGGFVPDAARRTLASLFRYNDTITIA